MRFGFTASEAEELASRRGLPPRRLPQMRDWYDGCCFGGTDVGQLYLAGYVTTDDVAVPNDAMREHGRDRLRRLREALLGLDADGLSRAPGRDARISAQR